MGLEATAKQKIIAEYQLKEGDKGSPEVQIALLTNRIQMLTTHLKDHPKDKHSRHGLLNMVSKRRKLLIYIKKEALSRYLALIKRLNLRH